MTGDFIAPDFSAPLQLEERVRGPGSQATVRGMFIQGVVDQVKAATGRTPGRSRYLAFSDYPGREWMELLVDCAALLHPRLPPREALRRMGRRTYPIFAESTVGRVL